MTSQLPDISEEQRAVLERIYEFFRAGSPWPTFGQLDREFDRNGIDLPQVLGAITRHITRMREYCHDTRRVFSCTSKKLGIGEPDTCARHSRRRAGKILINVDGEACGRQEAIIR